MTEFARKEAGASLASPFDREAVLNDSKVDLTAAGLFVEISPKKKSGENSLGSPHLHFDMQ